MKTQLFQLTLIVVLLYTLCVILFLSCNVAGSEREFYRFEPRYYGLQANEKARVSYEAETVSVTRYEGDVPDPFKEQYALHSQPAVSRSRVEVSIDMAGQTNWVIENLEPERKGAGEILIAPGGGLSPKVKRTVIRNRRADFYDAAGKLIKSGRIDTPDLAQIDRLLSYTGTGNMDLNQKIALARQNGSLLYEYPNGNLTIRTWRELSDLCHGSEAVQEKVEVREEIDTARKVIVGTALYDRAGAVLEETRLKYREGSRELEHIHSVSVTTDRNHIKVKNVTDTYFEYLDIMVR